MNAMIIPIESKRKVTFTMVPNEVLEQMMKSSLFPPAARVMFYILRNTAGRHKDYMVDGSGTIANATGINDRNNARRAIARLEAEGFITVVQIDRYTRHIRLGSVQTTVSTDYSLHRLQSDMTTEVGSEVTLEVGSVQTPSYKEIKKERKKTVSYRQSRYNPDAEAVYDHWKKVIPPAKGSVDKAQAIKNIQFWFAEKKETVENLTAAIDRYKASPDFKPEFPVKVSNFFGAKAYVDKYLGEAPVSSERSSLDLQEDALYCEMENADTCEGKDLPHCKYCKVKK